MSNEEPLQTPQTNVVVAVNPKEIAEQPSAPSGLTLPRQISLVDMIHQWQPMGVRVVVDLPFVGNDSDFLFAIRNGPFIPMIKKTYLRADVKGPLDSLVWNNTRNVFHVFQHAVPTFPDKFPVHISHYDQPPLLAGMSSIFRRWRGTMHYRARVVAGFATQGYIFASSVRNLPSFAGVYDEFSTPAVMPLGDRSFREGMQNSYVLGDSSMFRHFEVSSQFEYAVPWYDQFWWLARRTRLPNMESKEKLAYSYDDSHLDNYILFGVRGAIASTSQGAQISFELEYRADEDFQFADPNVMTGSVLESLQSSDDYKGPHVRTVPSNEWTSDGIGTPTKKL